MSTYHSMNGPPLVVKKPARRRADRKHVCEFCNMTFKRSEHCARHRRGHTQEKPFTCRYCPKSYARADVVVRHEKDLHWELYVTRGLSRPHRGVNARTSGEVIGDEDTCSTPDTKQLSTSSEQNRSDTSRILSDQPTERLLMSPCVASQPSSPSTRIQQAIAALDFTTLHAEALSLNYMMTPLPSPPPGLEFLPTGHTSSEIQPSTPSDGSSNVPMSSSQSEIWTTPDEARSPPSRHTSPRRQNAERGEPDTILVPDEDILTLGPVFDPAWDPVITKTAAINGYLADLHREIMIGAGLWGR